MLENLTPDPEKDEVEEGTEEEKPTPPPVAEDVDKDVLNRIKNKIGSL